MTIIIRLTHANVWESMGKPCSCVQFIKNRIFYCKSRENPYQYYKSCENPYRDITITGTCPGHAHSTCPAHVSNSIPIHPQHTRSFSADAKQSATQHLQYLHMILAILHSSNTTRNHLCTSCQLLGDPHHLFVNICKVELQLECTLAASVIAQ